MKKKEKKRKKKKKMKKKKEKKEKFQQFIHSVFICRYRLLGHQHSPPLQHGGQYPAPRGRLERLFESRHLGHAASCWDGPDAVGGLQGCELRSVDRQWGGFVGSCRPGHRSGWQSVRRRFQPHSTHQFRWQYRHCSPVTVSVFFKNKNYGQVRIDRSLHRLID